MSGKNNQSRNAAGLITSVIFHVLLIGLIINQTPPDYIFPPTQVIPEPPVPTQEPAMDVRIMKLPITPPKILPPTVPPTPAPTPPKPAPPQPQPQPQPVVPAHPQILPPTPTPAPPTPTPPTPAPAPPKPPPPKPAPIAPPIAAPAPPTPSPAPRPAPNPAAVVTKAPPTPAPTQAKPAPAAPAMATAPTALNIHKAAQAAPAGVPTLPMAPSPGPAGKAGAPAAAQAGAPGASRLNGLTPYPYGFMPNGGGGLRGTLVGCANAEAVHLSGAERDRCNERFGVDMSGAPKLDSLSPTKRAAFDKAADHDSAWAKYRDSGAGAAGPSLPGGIDHGPASSVILDHPAGDYPPK